MVTTTAKIKWILKMKNVVNLTPHDVKLFTGIETIVFPKSGKIVRVKQNNVVTGKRLFGAPIYKPFFSEAMGLPDPEEGVTYIVSKLVLDAAPKRKDLVAPLTDGSAIRDEEGNIEAVIAWIS